MGLHQSIMVTGIIGSSAIHTRDKDYTEISSQGRLYIYLKYI